jgi:hypothetical protein
VWKTQRQWSEKAIVRTTPSLLALQSLDTLGMPSARPRRSSLCRSMVQENRLHLLRCNRRRSHDFVGVRTFIDSTRETPTFPKPKQNASSARHRRFASPHNVAKSSLTFAVVFIGMLALQSIHHRRCFFSFPIDCAHLVV